MIGIFVKYKYKYVCVIRVELVNRKCQIQAHTIFYIERKIYVNVKIYIQNRQVIQKWQYVEIF